MVVSDSVGSRDTTFVLPAGERGSDSFFEVCVRFRCAGADDVSISGQRAVLLSG